MLHSIAPWMMFAVGLTLVILYFTINSSGVVTKGEGEDVVKSLKTFNNALAGILSIGSMFMAFSLATIAIERKVGSSVDLGGSFDRYMGFMLVIGVIVISLASVAIAQLSEADTNKSAKTQLGIMLGLSIVATLISGGWGVMRLTGKKAPGFGFDFEF